MTKEQVNKSISQIRQMFAFLGIATALQALLLLFGDPTIVRAILFLILALASACFWIAFINLGKRNKKGHTFAVISSVLFLFSFPVLTLFGVIYLRKLAKPEMKAALQNYSPDEYMLK